MNYSLVSKTAASVLLVGVLAACGGSGIMGAPPVVAPTTFTVAGTAASGAVFDNATVTIIASDGTQYPAAGATVVITGADGSYTITLPLTAKPPFVVQAVRDDKTLVSVVAEAKSTTTNITPVTTLIASRLSTSGDPANLASEIKANPALVDATKLAAKVTEIVTLIQPLMTAVGSTANPLNGTLVVGSIDDKVLDSLSITITPSSASTSSNPGSVNIAVSVKQQLADNAQPAVITFLGGATSTPPPAPLATVTAANLVTTGTSTLIADLLKRMTACNALAQTVRVNSGGTTAADIIAPACKDLFLGNDPTSYKHNGAIVSSKGAFSGIFSSNTGATFDRGNYDFTRENGDLVIDYRATDSSGNSTNNGLVVRTDTDGKLRAIGNQYKYDGGVNAYHQLATFVYQPAATYYSTGYNLNVSNSVDANGKSIFAKVVVTAPNGKDVFTLKPTAGLSILTLVKNPGVATEVRTITSFLRLRSVYTDPTNAAAKKDPMLADTTVFSSSTAFADADIAALPAQANWQFDYYLAGNTTTTPDKTQNYKTRARAMTIAELQTQPLANLTDADIASAKANVKTFSNGAKTLLAPTTGPVTLDWVVPTGALAPTNIRVVGRTLFPVAAGSTTAPAPSSFDDSASVASTARTGNIACSSATAGDPHCDSKGNYNYVSPVGTTTGFNNSQLQVTDSFGRMFDSRYTFYLVTIP